MTTAAFVFPFDTKAAEDTFCFGPEFDTAFLRAVAGADPDGLTNTTVCRGDAMPSYLATKITNVESDGLRTQHTQSYDMDVYRTVIWDAADSISEQWNSVDPEAFPIILGNRGVHCIATPTLPVGLGPEIDSRLRGTRGYLGAIEIDLGNPIQCAIFIDYLIKDAVVTGGQVVMELGPEGYPNSIFDGGGSFLPGGTRWVNCGELSALHPPIPIPTNLSRRGQISLDRYQGKRQFSLQDRVIAALARADRTSAQHQNYRFAATAHPQSPLEASLPESKFVQYLLDECHPEGGPKAKFFREALGIGPAEWRYLAAQFHDGLIAAELVEVDVRSFPGGQGVRFNADIAIMGLNGKSANVATVWQMELGKRPQLITAKPGPHLTRGRLATAPPIILELPEGDDKWAAIHRLAAEAGRDAADRAVPTPMHIAGYGTEMEGACGGAAVRIKDARRGYAKWAISSGVGSRGFRPGARVYAEIDSQSAHRAHAYATSYAAVLQHNGIDCEVESWLD